MQIAAWGVTNEERKFGDYDPALRLPLDPKMGLVPTQTEADRSVEQLI